MFKGLFTIHKPVNHNKIKVDTTGLDLQRIPRHIAIIMDGNGRWAREQGKVRTYGHQVGAETLKTIVKVADALGVKVITAYAFSTENWKRPITEVSFIMDLLGRYLTNEIDEFNENNVQVRFIGSREGMPAVINEKMDHALVTTAQNTGLILNLAINYGGQAEILHAVQKIAEKVKAGSLSPDAIDAAVFEDNLYTQGLPPPDLVIRPGGDLRVSNFLLWQIAYAEIWSTKVYWPAFTPELFLEAIKAYQGRERRFGGLVK